MNRLNAQKIVDAELGKGLFMVDEIRRKDGIWEVWLAETSTTVVAPYSYRQTGVEGKGEHFRFALDDAIEAARELL